MELLVVVLIVGLLAAIALPAFLGQRQGAQDSNAKSLLVSGSIAMEAYFQQNDGDFSAATPAALGAIEPTMTWLSASGARARNNEVSVTNLGTRKYTLSTISDSGRQFSVDRDYNRSPALVRSCTAAPTACSGAAW